MILTLLFFEVFTAEGTGGTLSENGAFRPGSEVLWILLLLGGWAGVPDSKES